MKRARSRGLPRRFALTTLVCFCSRDASHREFFMMLFRMLRVGVLTGLLSLWLVPLASGQLAPTQRVPRNVPLETYDNPPAAPRVMETSPRMISQFGSFTSFQVNVNASGQNILGDAANECSISVNPIDGTKKTIAWRQFNDVTSNFRQGGWGYTTNGGTTWTFPGVLENGVFRSDPVTKSDEVGNFFYLSLQSDVNEDFFCDDLWRSLNGGQSWTLLSGEKGGGGGDKQWLTIDKTSGPGHGFQYQSDDGINCSGGGVQFQRSINGGVTWQSPIVIPNSPTDGTLDVDSNGNLFIGGEGFSQFFCERSSNAQLASQTPTFDQSKSVNLGGFLGSGGINPAGLDGMVFLAIDHSGGPTNNNIYMLASVVPSGRSTTDVMFVRSTDGGLTFSTPKKINDDPVNPSKWHWFGTFSVAPNGRLDAVWYDTRNAANNTDSQLFYSWSTDAGVTWAPNVAVSIAFNPFEGYPNQSKIGDYITMVSDSTGADVAYSATFNFNASRNQHEEDVYYVRVAPTASGINLLSAASRLTHGAAGTFDVNMPLTGVSGVECRSATTYNAVFTFDAPVTSGQVTVLSGTATVGAITFSGNSMTAQLTGVTAAEVVTLHTQNINGDGLPHGDVPFGFLVADADASRVVGKSDQTLVKGQLNQPVTSANFREDLNADGRIKSADTNLVGTNKGHSIP
ncbi:MAG TPA: sialidase family protein [Chthoniobacterales bacterium]|nr:sialidase family protein [Chthoniobacterales bacterium]